MNKKAQTFPLLIIFILGFVMFILALPLLNDAINQGTNNVDGDATTLVMKLFPWVIALVLVAVFFAIINRGGLFG